MAPYHVFLSDEALLTPVLGPGAPEWTPRSAGRRVLTKLRRITDKLCSHDLPPYMVVTIPEGTSLGDKQGHLVLYLRQLNPCAVVNWVCKGITCHAVQYVVAFDPL